MPEMNEDERVGKELCIPAAEVAQRRNQIERDPVIRMLFTHRFERLLLPLTGELKIITAEKLQIVQGRIQGIEMAQAVFCPDPKTL